MSSTQSIFWAPDGPHLPAPQPGNCLKVVSGGNLKINLICFHLSEITLHYLMSSFLKIMFYIFCLGVFFFFFRQEGKSVPCYSILAEAIVSTKLIFCLPNRKFLFLAFIHFSRCSLYLECLCPLIHLGKSCLCLKTQSRCLTSLRISPM